MFRFLSRLWRKQSPNEERRRYAGVLFVSQGNADAFLELLPAEYHTRAREMFPGLAVHQFVKLDATWAVGRAEDEAVVVYTPQNGLDSKGYIKAVARFNPNRLEIIDCPWPWLDDEQSYLEVLTALKHAMYDEE